MLFDKFHIDTLKDARASNPQPIKIQPGTTKIKIVNNKIVYIYNVPNTK